MTPFKPRSIKELAEMVTEAVDWLVHGLLPVGVAALLVAYPKVGKSTLAAQLAVAVAKGRDFLGRPTRQGGVLYIVAEERRDDVMRRLRQFGMADDDPIWLWSETVADTSDDRDKIRRFVGDNGVSLVIVDTWASYLMIADETDNSLVTIRMKPYVDMAHNSGATILFIHHERKSSDDVHGGTQAIRGGGAILGLADVAFQLKRDGGDTKRRLKAVGRFSEIPSDLSLDYRDDGYVCLGTPEEASRAAQRDKIVAALSTDEPGATVEEVVASVGLKKGATRTALESAYAAKIAGRTGEGKRGDPYRYFRIVDSHEPAETAAVA